MSEQNGAAAPMPIPPVDPGNAFVLAVPLPSIARLTTVPATMSDGTRVLVTTFRTDGTTLTLRLTRDDAIAFGRQLVKGGQELGGLIVPAPGVHP